MVEQLRMPAFRDLLVNQGWAGPSEIDAMTVDILAWGGRPDAYATVLSPAAIGWVTKPG
jgi:hypothetical protein